MSKELELYKAFIDGLVERKGEAAFIDDGSLIRK